MEEDPLIPLVHVWNNAAFDNSSSSASAWQTHAAAAAAAISKGDKENHRPDTDDIGVGFDVDAEIGHIEAEILRLSSRLHHLRTSRQSEPKRDADASTGEIAAKVRPRPRGLSLGPLDVISGTNPNLLSEKQPPPAAQRLKPIKQPVSRGRGLSLGPLDIAAANPKVPAAQQQKQGAGAARILKPIKEPPVQRRRGVSLGPLEIHHGVGSKPNAAAAARVKPFPNKLNAIREEGQISMQPAVPAKPWPSSNTRHPLDAKQGAAAGRAKARSSSMSPRSRRQSIAKATDTRGGIAVVGGNKVVDELKPKGVFSHTGNAAIGRRPAGSSKVRVIPSRYSLTPGASLGDGTQEKRRKQSLQGSAAGASQREEIRAKVIEPSNDQQSPHTIAKIAELLPRIRTMPCDESPRDSGCAKRVADLVGKRYFFTAAAGDGTAVSSYQARVIEVEAPEVAAAEA